MRVCRSGRCVCLLVPNLVLNMHLKPYGDIAASSIEQGECGSYTQFCDLMFRCYPTRQLRLPSSGVQLLHVLRQTFPSDGMYILLPTLVAKESFVCFL